MNDARTTRDSTSRTGARDRVASALVTNYIHELSDRHGGADRPPSPSDDSPEIFDRPEGD